MIAKDKAQELVFKFTVFDYQVNGFKHITEMEHEAAKRCAVMCVDEILNVGFLDTNDLYYYWNEVKQEINKL